MTRTLAPGRVVRGPGALEAVAAEIARLGSRPVLVHGRVGEAVVRPRLDPALDRAELTAARVEHTGPVTSAAITQLTSHLRRSGGDVVVAIGGGRVLDAGKAAAHATGLPFVSVPTSPATCAAVTAISVVYDDVGAWAGPLFGDACPAVCVLDGDVLASAPDRLLAAGIVDAFVKVREVRLAVQRTHHDDPWSASALAQCAVLAALVDPSATGVTRAWPPTHAQRDELAEAVVWLPGLIAGLAGEANKLAAAHAVHNALTWLPGHERALHGELVAVGLLVQDALDGADDATLAGTMQWMRSLGIDPSLAGVGCAALWEDPAPVLERVLTHPAMRTAFPSVDLDALTATLRRVDALARSD